MSDDAPNIDSILERLKAGAEFCTGGGRWNETYKWKDGRLVCTTFDEGLVFDEDATVERLAKAVRDHPDRLPKL